MPCVISEDFLLQTPSAQRLYIEYASNQPIIDYHCHLSPKEIAKDRQFENMAQIWLSGDHYKWRALRAAGIEEKYITGSASDWEKFEKWASICPLTIRNPLFHWTMLELNRPFGINDCYLSQTTARQIWEKCNEKLHTKEFSARNIIKQMDVKVICTTDDPIDSLEHHIKLRSDYSQGTFPVKVLPTFRPDKVFPTKCITSDGVASYLKYLSSLGEVANIEINSFSSLRSALEERHNYFHQNGARLSDCSFGVFEWELPTSNDSLESTFSKILKGTPVPQAEIIPLVSILLRDLGYLNAQKGWVSQIHLGALRDNSTRLFELKGPDAGCDSMDDRSYAQALSSYLDDLDRNGNLPKTIVYNLNPAYNYMLASLVNNFNDGSTPGKMQYGSGWWFLDQKHGIEKQLETLSNMGLLSYFVGMLTDSRSFLSYTRHEYFRRILCNILGSEMEQGLLPTDFEWIGGIVKRICYTNALEYFRF